MYVSTYLLFKVAYIISINMLKDLFEFYISL